MPPRYFAPWSPTGADRFDRRKAAHLLRRSGFGASPPEIEGAIGRGLEATVDGLFDEDEDQERDFRRTFEAIKDTLINFGDADWARAWWLHRMVRTRTPLREKLALFWHGHFATSVEKVEDAALMHRQVETFRRLAWGRFPDLVLAVARDPAMLVWLDGESSTKEHPNENFARELMELFTIGIGHYDERDVREAARAFTGWHRDGADFAFEADAHDAGPKRFLGESGRLDGGDVVDILMHQPATTRALASKLIRAFAAPEPAEDVVNEAAEVLGQAQLDVKWFLRKLFKSRYFYSADCLRSRISGPVEFAVGTIRTLGARWPASDFREHLDGMGQSLLAPPNVKGWDGERAWINTSTWAARVRFAEELANLQGDGEFEPGLDLGRLPLAKPEPPARVVDQLADLLMPGDFPAEARELIAAFLVATDEGPKPDRFADDEDFRTARVRGALALILTLPEYHAY